MLGVATVLFAIGHALTELVIRYYDTRSLDEVQRVYIRKPLSQSNATDHSVGGTQVETATRDTTDRRDVRSRETIDNDDAYRIEIK